VPPLPVEPLEPIVDVPVAEATEARVDVEPALPKLPFMREYGLRPAPVEPEVAGVPTEPRPTEPRPTSSGRRLVDLALPTALVLVIALLIAIVIRTFVAQAYLIPTDSMQPKLDVGDRIVVDKLSYVLHGPRRGDIVVFDSPLRPPSDHAALPVRMFRRGLEAVGLRQPDTDTLVKRVVALPGETVAGRNGRLLVDGKPLAEPYLAAGTVTSTFGPERVGDGKLWVMGDRRGTSRDSRNFGPIPRGSVVGRAGLKLWPVSELGRV
jgi:signal peptidase I